MIKGVDVKVLNEEVGNEDEFNIKKGSINRKKTEINLIIKNNNNSELEK